MLFYLKLERKLKNKTLKMKKIIIWALAYASYYWSALANNTANDQPTWATNTTSPTDLWVFGDDSGVTQEDFRKWDIHIEDIPVLIKWATDVLLWLAGTVALIFIIIGAYQILFGSLTQQKTQWRDTIILALSGFAIASLSWFIIKVVLDNFS